MNVWKFFDAEKTRTKNKVSLILNKDLITSSVARARKPKIHLEQRVVKRTVRPKKCLVVFME